MPQLFSKTTTAQQVVNSVAQDVRQTLGSTGGDANILLDYVNRVSLDILRASRWKFLISGPKAFLTEEGQTSYYLGAGTAPPGVQNAALALTDLRLIQQGSVNDRSNFRPLGFISDAPNIARLSFPDGSSRPGRPAMWSQDPSNPLVMQIFPAPDNQNTYQQIPPTPALRSEVGGTSPTIRAVSVRLSYVDVDGNEGSASLNNLEVVPINSLLHVISPLLYIAGGFSSEGASVSQYNVYASTDIGNETLQNAVPITIGTDWVEPIGGLITSGPDFPTSSNLVGMQGYLIEFKYWAQRVPVTSLSQVLQVPDDYFDVVVDGVNARAFKYLTRPQEAQSFMQDYKAGLISIVRDTNLFFIGGANYISPDNAALGGTLPAIETIDLSFLTP